MIPLDEQARLAVSQLDFRNRIVAGAFAAAVAANGAVALADPVKQTQRLQLVNALVRDPRYTIDTFAWLVVSRPALNTATDITDNFIVTIITNTFDTVAQQLFQVAA